MNRIAIFSLILFCASMAVAETLFKYDDFSDSTASAAKWTKDAWQDTRVSYDGGVGTVDMYSGASNKYARMIMNVPAVLQDASDQYRITFDMYIASDTTQGYLNGISIGPDGSNVTAGQFGLAGSGSAQHAFYLAPTGNDATDHGLAWYHYDLTITSTGQTLNVYTYNAAWNDTPEEYVLSGSSLWTQNASVVFDVETDLDIRFYAQLAYGIDASSNPRNKIQIDNVFTSVPEPITAIGCIFSGLLVSVWRRKK